MFWSQVVGDAAQHSIVYTLRTLPSVEAALLPITRPSQPQCKYAQLYRSASASVWLTPSRVSTTPTPTTPTVTGHPVSITGQPAKPTTDNLASPTLVVLIIV